MVVKTYHKERNFTIIDNGCLQRADVSARAKGLWAYLMSLPEDWEVHQSEVNTHFTEGTKAMRSAWAELSTAGYVEKRRVRGSGGKMTGWEISVYEVATGREAEKDSSVDSEYRNRPICQKPKVGSPTVGKRHPTKDLLEQSTNLTKDIACADTHARMAPPSRLKDPVANHMQGRFLQVMPVEAWGNVASERKHCTTLARKASAMAVSQGADPAIVVDQILRAFYRRIHNTDSDYWRCAFVPSALASRWSQVVADIVHETDDEIEARELEEMERQMLAENAV